jgi:hypothetical protein
MKSQNNTTVTGPGGGGKRREADEDKRGNKKKGKGNNEAHSLVKNVFPHGEICMLTNETWAGNFSGKNANQRPQWNEKCKCCPCWFLKKYCFSDCPNKESHVPAKKVLLYILQQMLPWIKACRN